MPKLPVFRIVAAPSIGMALALALSACDAQTPNTASPTQTGTTTEPSASPEPDDSPEATPTEMTAPVGSPSGLSPVSCSAQIGAARARTLVQQCLRVSPATRPPCNAANSCAMIEGEIARSCALLGDDAKGERACSPNPKSGEAAVAAVKRYYAAINAHDLPTAWSVWGPDGNPEQNFDEFAKGYAATAKTTVTTGSPSRVEGAAGSLYVEVPVTVDAQLVTGRQQHFTGSYTLRQLNMGPSQGWHIASAMLTPS